jgi:uncharacterized protein YecE (DUF72 family)
MQQPAGLRGSMAMAKSAAKSGTIRTGVGGWTYKPWRGRFFPDGLPQARELAFAAAHFPALEVNGTFYRTQTPKTFARWRAEAPEGFVFALKAPRYATNRARLSDAGESVHRFLDSGLSELGPALGPINWQLPPTRVFEQAEIGAFLELLPDRLGNLQLRHSLEVRHPSFDCDAFRRQAEAHRVAVVLAGDGTWPRIDAPAPDFAYLRLLGTQPGEPLGYASEALDRWARAARDLAAGGRDVFLFVIGGHKVANPDAATALMERLGDL